MIGLLLRLGAVTLVFAALFATVMLRTDTVTGGADVAEAGSVVVVPPAVVKAPQPAAVTPAPSEPATATEADGQPALAATAPAPGSATRSIAALVGTPAKAEKETAGEAREPALAFAEPTETAVAVDAIMPDTVEATAVEPSLVEVPLPVPDPRIKLRKKARAKP